MLLCGVCCYRCPLLVVCLLFVFGVWCCLLLAGCCVLFVVVGCEQLVEHRLMFGVCCVLFANC